MLRSMYTHLGVPFGLVCFGVVSVIAAVSVLGKGEVSSGHVSLMPSNASDQLLTQQSNPENAIPDLVGISPRNVVNAQMRGSWDSTVALPSSEMERTVASLYPVDKVSRNLEDALLLIGGIDGSLTAFSANAIGSVANGAYSSTGRRPLWTINTPPGSLVVSSLSKIELMRNGVPMQIIPSLDGSLFSFDGDKIEALPVSADSLLSSSFKISEDSVITGGKESVVYGIDPTNGKVKYSCGMHGCNNQPPDINNLTADERSGTLLVSRLSQTVRAFDVHQGSEKWNFSVGSLDIAISGPQESDRKFHRFDTPHCAVIQEEPLLDDEVQFRFDVPTGIVQAVSMDGKLELWQHQLKQPITSAWLVRNNCVRSLNLVAKIHPMYDPLLSKSSNDQLIYIGFHEEQLYIQRAGPVKEIPLSRSYPQVVFRPLLINAPSRTPAISEVYRPFLPNKLLKHGPDEKALVPIGPLEYPFDNGYYIASEPHGEGSNPALEFADVNVILATGEDGGRRLLNDILRHWQEITGLMVLPLVVSLVLGRQYFRKKIMKLQSESELLKRQNNSTRSLASVISLQEMATKHSRFCSDFEVLERLGKGGFGVVYMAKNRLDDNIYAVKKIDLPKSDAAREKVRREVRVLAKLDHVGIIRFYNAWVETSDPVSEASRSSTDQEKHDRGDHPTILSSATSTDLQCQWIGTQRNKHPDVFFSDNADLDPSLRLVPNEKHTAEAEDSNVIFEGSNRKSEEDSVEIVFEASGKKRVDSIGSTGSKRQRKGSDRKKSSPSLSGLSEVEKADSAAIDGKKGTGAIILKPQLFIQMELCRKETLKDWLGINQEVRVRNHVLDIYYQIVCAVEYIHGRGLMHRDLKPSNILFSLDGTAVKVGDFGLVTSTDDEEIQLAMVAVEERNYMSVQDHTNQVGTSLYMSPELIAGKAYDEKVDMYSLGLILFELLVPFKTEMERVYSMIDAKNLKFDALTYTCSQKGDEYLLSELLSVNPADRPCASHVRNCDIFHELLILMEETGAASGRRRGHSVSLSDFFQKR